MLRCTFQPLLPGWSKERQLFPSSAQDTGVTLDPEAESGSEDTGGGLIDTRSLRAGRSGVDRSQGKAFWAGGAAEPGRCCLETERTLWPEHKRNIRCLETVEGDLSPGKGRADSLTSQSKNMAMARRVGQMKNQDEVHQNQILRELFLKELRAQKLYTQYHVNPLRKVHTITRKPMSWHDNLEEPEDAKFLNLIHHAAQGPKKKYSETQTEAQEIGWDPNPLINPDRQDYRLNHFRVYHDITLYQAKLWSLGEDDHQK
uniref:Protein FAM183A n=1 Tax=Mus spicilegus TaxID=10103 RepID=A0A8C6HR65_MUSSI